MHSDPSGAERPSARYPLRDYPKISVGRAL